MTVTDLMSRRGPRTAWVLGGGGNLGSIQVGMLRALADRGEIPDLVVGCSVGALNGLAMAADPSPEGVERLRRTWLDVRGDALFPATKMSGPWMLLKKSPSLYPDDGLRDLIDRCAPYDRIEEYPIPFECVATNLATGRARWFDRGRVDHAVLASAALPAALPPVEIDGDRFIDGAVVDNVPISRAVHHGIERIIILHVGNFDRPRPTPKRPIDVLLQSFSIARNFRFDEDLARVPDDVEVVVIPGIDPGSVKRNDFGRTAELIERAHASTAAFLDLRAHHRTG
ncbi:MAG: patatin-like phospholipase family protein [Acidimicrobiales bacterium]|nr:patatin-like phospholipase family protein [Acidimicrobiales bacterium]